MTTTTSPAAEANEGHGPEVLYEVADHVATDFQEGLLSFVEQRDPELRGR